MHLLVIIFYDLSAQMSVTKVALLMPQISGSASGSFTYASCSPGTTRKQQKVLQKIGRKDYRQQCLVLI